MAEDLGAREDDSGFYGKSYWLSHQEASYGLPDIFARARTDFCDRIPYWLWTLLRHRLPPSRVLELGASHGGFVALMRWAGFDATGLEMSSWVAGFAQETFGAPMAIGPVEGQDFGAGTFGVIALMDVLEHIPDPVATMRHCAMLLDPDGIMLVQTPCFREDKTLEEMIATGDPFPEQLKEAEHLFLFTERAARRLFTEVGLPWIVSEPAVFPHDMLLVVGRRPREAYRDEEIAAALLATPAGRLVLALLEQRERLRICEADREARLKAIEYLQGQLRESEADREARLKAIEYLKRQLRSGGAGGAGRGEG